MHQKVSRESPVPSADELFAALPELLTIGEVAVLLRVHRNTLMRWRQKEIGPQAHALPGGGWRYRQDEVLAWARDSCPWCRHSRASAAATDGS